MALSRDNHHQDKHLHVFGHGSLLHPTHKRGLSKTVPDHGLTFDSMKRARLEGYRRRLSAFAPVEGEPSAKFQAFWNVEAEARASCLGVVFPVDEKVLRELDYRERRYVRMEVTDQVELLDEEFRLEESAVVFTYVCLPSEELVRAARGVTGLSSEYEACVNEAAQELGQAYVTEVAAALEETLEWPRL